MDFIDFSLDHQAFDDATAPDISVTLDESAPASRPYAPSSPSPLQGGQQVDQAFYTPSANPSGSAPSSVPPENKTRLTREQHDILEQEYQQQNKPTTQTKRKISENLGVALDKINNWFQNRRAKAKQDVKKLVEAQTKEQEGDDQAPVDEKPVISQAPLQSIDSSAPFTSSEATQATTEWAFNKLPDSFGSLPNGSTDEAAQAQNDPTDISQFFPEESHPTSRISDSRRFHAPQAQSFFESPLDVNRRTLTQEQFDAFARDNGTFDAFGGFQSLDTAFGGQQDALDQVFPEMSGIGHKHHDSVYFPYPYNSQMAEFGSQAAPSHHNQASFAFPSAMQMHNQAGSSVASSEFGDSRQSSLSFAGSDEPSFPGAKFSQQQQPQTTQSTSQWQPGQSIPVDINALNEQFRQAAQARPAQPRMRSFDQSFAWPSENAALRRGSQTSLLAQSLSNVGIHTPQPSQSGGFKSPAPPSSIAARRQRPRPAALGMAALRSQSYSDGLGPSSAGPAMQQSTLNGPPGLRRIRSSNVVNGVAQGRVMKSIPGSAQRSPLAFTFADSINSPKFARHLGAPEEYDTPPTPSSPKDSSWAEQNGQFPFWPSQGLHAADQTNASDAEAPAGLSFQSFEGISRNYAGSPPHTPHYYQQSFPQHLGGGHVAHENTPPQSAPATQSTFPSGLFAPSASLPQASRAGSIQNQQAFATAHQTAAYPQKQLMNIIVPESQAHQAQSQQQAGAAYAMPNQAAAQMSGLPPPAPIQFTNCVPTINAEGNIQMSFPPPEAQPVQRPLQPSPQSLASLPSDPSLNHHMSSMYPQTNYHFIPAPGSTQFPSASPPQFDLASHQPPPPPPIELHVHEYTPPDDVKTSSTSRKPIDFGGPKNYTFSNHTSGDFEANGGKVKKGGPASVSSSDGGASAGTAAASKSSSGGTASLSPGSSNGSSSATAAAVNGAGGLGSGIAGIGSLI